MVLGWLSRWVDGSDNLLTKAAGCQLTTTPPTLHNHPLPRRPAHPASVLQLFLEQNEEEAEKMEAKEEKQREIEKSQIKVRGGGRCRLEGMGGWRRLGPSCWLRSATATCDCIAAKQCRLPAAVSPPLRLAADAAGEEQDEQGGEAKGEEGEGQEFQCWHGR